MTVTHTKSALKGLVSPRELCSAVLRIRDHDAGTIINAAHGVGENLRTLCPILSSHVRGSMFFWGCLLSKDARPGFWNMTMCMQVSVNGWVPSSPVISETVRIQKNFFVYADKYVRDGSAAYADDHDDDEDE